MRLPSPGRTDGQGPTRVSAHGAGLWQAVSGDSGRGRLPVESARLCVARNLRTESVMAWRYRRLGGPQHPGLRNSCNPCLIAVVIAVVALMVVRLGHPVEGLSPAAQPGVSRGRRVGPPPVFPPQTATHKTGRGSTRSLWCVDQDRLSGFPSGLFSCRRFSRRPVTTRLRNQTPPKQAGPDSGNRARNRAARKCSVPKT